MTIPNSTGIASQQPAGDEAEHARSYAVGPPAAAPPRRLVDQLSCGGGFRKPPKSAEK